MESIHIKIDFSEALTSKKNLLSSEINLLNINKRMENYINLRKEEFKKKMLLRTKINNTVIKLNNLKKNLPNAGKKQDREIITDITRELEKTTNLEQELREVKDRLSKLNS